MFRIMKQQHKTYQFSVTHLHEKTKVPRLTIDIMSTNLQELKDIHRVFTNHMGLDIKDEKEYIFRTTLRASWLDDKYFDILWFFRLKNFVITPIEETKEITKIADDFMPLYSQLGYILNISLFSYKQVAEYVAAYDNRDEKNSKMLLMLLNLGADNKNSDFGEMKDYHEALITSMNYFLSDNNGIYIPKSSPNYVEEAVFVLVDSKINGVKSSHVLLPMGTEPFVLVAAELKGG